MLKGIPGCRRRVIVYSDRLSRGLGEVFGRCFGATVDGSERKEGVCLDGREMLYAGNVPSVTAISIYC